MSAALAAALLVLAAASCFRLSLLHRRLAHAYQLVSDMLGAGDKTDANCLAEAEMRRMKARKWWQA